MPKHDMTTNSLTYHSQFLRQHGRHHVTRATRLQQIDWGIILIFSLFFTSQLCSPAALSCPCATCVNTDLAHPARSTWFPVPSVKVQALFEPIILQLAALQHRVSEILELFLFNL